MSGDVVSLAAARHPVDPRVPQRRAADPAASVWVAASAGTGKTKVLSDRVLSLMLAGTEPRKILCLTFTRAAAAEMATRIAQTLGTWATAEQAALEETLADLLGHPPGADKLRLARRLFADVIDAPGGMNIQTIHAFCQSLLGRFPLEAGVAPHFAVMDERDAQEMLAAAREDVLSHARLSDGSDLAHGLAAVTAHVHEQTFSDLMGELAARRGALRRLMARFGGANEQATRHIRQQLGLKDGETAESVIADTCTDNAFEGLLLRSATAALQQGGKSDTDRAPVMATWLAGTAAERQTQFNAYAACFLVADAGRGLRKVRSRMITKAALATMAGADAVLAAEAERLLTVAQRRRAAVCAEATAGLLRLGGAMLEAYEAQKRRRALLDYEDLIGLTRDLLARPDVAAWVLFKLDGGIDHVLIDEAQDTNPDQWDVVAHLTGEFFAGAGARDETRTVFAVGDVKQSIFSFQGADPIAFQKMRDHYESAAQAAGQTWRQEALTVSFRSTRAVLSAVDRVFAASPARDGVALDGADIRHIANRHADAGLVEVWAPTEAAESDPPPPWKPPVEAVAGDSPRVRLADVLARRIQRMTTGGEMLESKGRPIHAGDILVLVRQRGAFVEDLVRALKQIGVEVAGVDRMVLSDQLAVMDLVALGNFLLLPEDDLTLATILKSPLIGLSEEHLFTLAYDRQGTLWQSLTEQADGEPIFAAALAYLADLLARADFVPPYELFAHVLGPLGGRRRLVARLGFEAEDPIAEFMDLALSFERHHTASLQGFLHWLEAGAVEIKRDLEHSARDAVRVMTVHGAKGLQAPIVFLPDTMRVPRGQSRVLWPRGDDGEPFLLWPPNAEWRDAAADQEFERLAAHRDEEYRRLLYVAMTRAEDRLYVCGWGGRQKAPDGCWYNLIRQSLATVPADAGDDVVFESAVDIDLSNDREMDSGEVLRLVCPQIQPAASEAHRAPVAAIQPLPDWVHTAPNAEPDPPRPLAPSRPSDEEPPVRSPFGADDGARFRRGRLIHRLLQSLPDVAPAARADAARRFLLRPVHGLGPEEAAEIAAETIAVLDHPEHAALFGPGSRAEVPLAGAVAGRVVAAQVDRLLVTASDVTIVDYKTNRPPPRDVEAVPVVYLAQMAAYRALLGRIYPQHHIRCLLLWTDGPRLMTLPDALLDPHAP